MAIDRCALTKAGQLEDFSPACRSMLPCCVSSSEWVAETEPPEPKVSARTLGAVDSSEEKHGTRSIFDDIDEDE